MAVSLEKRLIILPRGLELKKRIGARATLLSIELWRVLLKWIKTAPIRKAVNPAIPIEESETTVNWILLCDRAC